MRFFSKFLLIIFIAFLATPTFVMLYEKNSDISVFYKFAEEEIQKELKDVKAFSSKEESNFLLLNQNKTSKINSEEIWFPKNTFKDIFIPPPDLV